MKRRTSKAMALSAQATPSLFLRAALVLAAALLMIVVLAKAGQSFTLNGVDAQVYFSPNGGCTEAIVAEIQKARQGIAVQAYSFTSPPIAQALVDAHKRGVQVEVVLDKSQRTERYSGATYLANAGIPVFIDDAHPIAHNKVMVFDGRKVVTGSFNFTKGGERNAENVLILDSPELARAYLQNWALHRQHSEPYSR